MSANDITALSILLVDDDDFVFAYRAGVGYIMPLLTNFLLACLIDILVPWSRTLKVLTISPR